MNDRSMFPTRYVNLDAARARHGDRVDRLGRMLFEGDPLADAVVEALATRPRIERDALVDRCLAEGIDAVPDAPPELRALFEELDRVPFWVERDRLDRGGAVILRAGILAGLVLGAYSLVLGYCSPAGNKPLAFSGRLEEDAPRRLAETTRFVEAVVLPRGMSRFGDGFKACVKVRLVHAAVRRMLARSDRWRTNDWGAPINQPDMAGTAMLFSLVVLDGLERLGFRTTSAEREDLLHLYRYVARVMGVREELCFASEHEARAFWDLLTTTQAEPDDDSRALTRALFEGPIKNARNEHEMIRARRSRALGLAFARTMLGDQVADRLEIPRTRAIHAIRALRVVNRRAPGVWRFVPNAPFSTVDAGRKYWRFVVEQTLRGKPAGFEMPDRLRREP